MTYQHTTDEADRAIADGLDAAVGHTEPEDTPTDQPVSRLVGT